MTNLIINRDSGKKPYIPLPPGPVGGYVEQMRRTTQRMDKDVVAQVQKQIRRGEVLADREVIQSIVPVSVWTMPSTCWGIAFNPASGMYAAINVGDIYYKVSGGSFDPLSQAARSWEEISVAPNGNVYCVDFAAGIYVRTGGTGDFTLLEAGSFTCVSCGANGNIYAIKSNQLWLWNGSAFVSLNQTVRGYTGLTCAPNGDLYATVSGTGKIYIMAGGAGDLVELSQTISGCVSLSSAPNGDVFVANSGSIYRRAAGVGDFVLYYSITGINSMTCSPGGALYVATTNYLTYIIYLINSQSVTQPAPNTIVQNKVTPTTETKAQFKNLKPYANDTYSAMGQYATQGKYTGKEQEPVSEGALPVLVGHIEDITRYVRLGAPVVVGVPTTAKDPVVGAEVQGGGDGLTSIAPDGVSVIYKPGSSQSALLVVHTQSGQQCTVTLMAK